MRSFGPRRLKASFSEFRKLHIMPIMLIKTSNYEISNFEPFGKHINKAQRQKVREWQTVDTKIFERANETLWKKIENFGFDRMEKEVRELEKINLANAENCVDSYMPVKSLPVEFRSDLIFTRVYKRHALSSRKKYLGVPL